MGIPVFSYNGTECTGETYKSVVNLTFAKGVALPDPSGLLSSSLEGNVRRTIDIYVAEIIGEEAAKTLVRAAVALNSLKAELKPTQTRVKRAEETDS